MNEKVRAFIAEQRRKRDIQKQVDKLFNQKVYAEYRYQGEPNGTQKELEAVGKFYQEQIDKLERTL